jgi:hypothetical protein
MVWIAGLCDELKWKHPMSLMLGDNEGAISMTVKPGKQSKSKHIDNKRHMVRCNVELKQLITQIGTEGVVADIMTKALGAVKLTRLRCELKVLPIVSKDSEARASQTTDEARASSTPAERRD